LKRKFEVYSFMKWEVKCELYSFMKWEVKCELYSFMKWEVKCELYSFINFECIRREKGYSSNIINLMLGHIKSRNK
jgi:hypothetical protein